MQITGFVDMFITTVDW